MGQLDLTRNPIDPFKNDSFWPTNLIGPPLPWLNSTHPTCFTTSMHSGIVNKTRYDDPEKPMKQTSFTIKNLGGNLPEKQSTIEKKSFRFSTKPLSLDSTISVDELTAETFYHFRTSNLFNIWTPPFLLHGSQYMTNSFARILVRDSLTNLKKIIDCKVLHFINNEDQEHLVTKP